jgi:hypothetical protein
VRVRPEALDALRIDRENVLARHFPLLESTGDEAAAAEGATVEADAGTPE